jgi:hypothetical protein
MPRKSKNDDPGVAKELKIYSGPKNSLPKGTRRATEKEALATKQIKWYGINEVSQPTKDVINSTGKTYKVSDLSKAFGKIVAKIVKVRELEKDIDNELRLNSDPDTQSILKEYKVLLKDYKQIMMKEYNNIIAEKKNKIINDDDDPRDGELKDGEYITSLPLNESFYKNIDLIRTYLTDHTYKNIKKIAHKKTLEENKLDREKKLAEKKLQKEKEKEIKRLERENKKKERLAAKPIKKKIEKVIIKPVKKEVKKEVEKVVNNVVNEVSDEIFNKMNKKLQRQNDRLNELDASRVAYVDMRKKLLKSNKAMGKEAKKKIEKKVVNNVVNEVSDEIFNKMNKKLQRHNDRLNELDASRVAYVEMKKKLLKSNKARNKEIDHKVTVEMNKQANRKKIINALIPKAAAQRELKKIENDVAKEQKKKAMEQNNMLIPIAAAGMKAKAERMNAIQREQMIKKMNTNILIPIAAAGRKARVKKMNRIQYEQGLKKMNTNILIPIAAAGMKAKAKANMKKLNAIEMNQVQLKNLINDEIKKNKKRR